MAGVTDAPFRYLATKLGADYAISEMITSQTHLWQSNKTTRRLKSNFIETPKIIQIGGACAEVVADGARACADAGADVIEINMGCPAKKVCNVLAGSALLRDEKLVADILSVAVGAVKIPVYLKTRLGWDNDNKNILTIAKIAEESGIQSLAIHGRTRCDYYNGSASYNLIAEAKANSKIPVFANGDVDTPAKALEVWKLTQTDGLYIGRGALGQPWLFQQVKDYIQSGSFKQPDLEFVLNLMLEHTELIHQHYGDVLGVRIARKHIKWYLEANTNLFSERETKFAHFAQIESSSEQLTYLNTWFIQ
ncbi:MAG: tRNA dihydrouridine synthase DusB [Burkholderiales bacterium]|jgi:tRNA-dihydrouridine synthase B|nr:tRNA dihydrouridine synthase DusB [Burkholderiales bacterium]